jgi:hypothetical protein
MLVGHFAVALAAKRVEPRVSLGTLVLAAMLENLLWCVFMIAGLEHVQFKPGKGAAKPSGHFGHFGDGEVWYEVSENAP